MKICSWVLALLAAASLAVPAAQAQESPPTTGAPSIALTFAHLDLGPQGLAGDCTELHTAAGKGGTGAAIPDIRLAACAGHAVGTLVGDNDTAELGSPATTPSLTLKWADTNADGRYDPGDFVYLDTAAGTGLTPSTTPAAFTLRVTSAMSYPAGTYAHAGDADMQAFGTAATPFATASLAWQDRDASVAFTPGDVAYLLPNVAPGYPPGSLFPLGSIRVTAAPTPSANPSTASPTPSPTGPGNATAPPPQANSTGPSNPPPASQTDTATPTATPPGAAPSPGPGAPGASQEGTGPGGGGNGKSVTIPNPVGLAIAALVAVGAARRRI